MFPTMEHYRRFGESLGEDIGPVADWEGFSQMKRYDHGILPNLRRIAGYEDRFGRNTYTNPTDHSQVRAFEALVAGFRAGATEEP